MQQVIPFALLCLIAGGMAFGEEENLVRGRSYAYWPQPSYGDCLDEEDKTQLVWETFPDDAATMLSMPLMTRRGSSASNRFRSRRLGSRKMIELHTCSHMDYAAC